jgi:hypothetical protein
VLAETTLKAEKKVISESVRAVTGDKTRPTVAAEDDAADSNVIELRRLAGL